MQPLQTEDTATINRKLALAQLHESRSQTLLARNFLAQQFDRLWQAVVNFAETTQEPKVTWRRDRQGRSYFEIYDPSTAKHHFFDSEQNALIWLDRVRYQQFSKSNEKLANKNFGSFDRFRKY